MISKVQIEKMINGGLNRQLIRRVLGNGRGLDAGLLLARLDERGGAALRAVALALAIERLDELTYGPDAALDRLVRSLLLLQDRWGRFPGGNAATTAIATAAAVGALIRRQGRAGALEEQENPELDIAIQHAAAAINQMQDADGLFSADLETSEIILWLLGNAAVSHPLVEQSIGKLRHTIAMRDAADPWSNDESSLGALALACAA